jgi:hypothetical protein
LRKELGASITDEEARSITALVNVRNRVARFAHHGEDPRRTEATMARGLDACWASSTGNSTTAGAACGMVMSRIRRAWLARADHARWQSRVSS